MNNLANIYYSPRGYWRGQAAVKKLAASGQGFGGGGSQLAQTASDMANLFASTKITIPRPFFDEDDHDPMPSIRRICYTCLMIAVGKGYVKPKLTSMRARRG